jgi:hypothetical protein
MKIWLYRLTILIIAACLTGWPAAIIPPARAVDIPTSLSIELACGDGFAESPEVCDPGAPPILPPDVHGLVCGGYNDIFGDPFQSGDLTCQSDCADYSTSTCYTCGNGYKEPIEQCDSSDFGGATCEFFGLVSGYLACTNQCLLVLSNCISQQEPGQGSPTGGSKGGAAGGTSGYMPGSEKEQITKVIITGKSYPRSEVNILLDSKVLGVVQADTKANFYFESRDVPAGVASFSFWSADKEGIKSTLLTLTVRIISGAVTTITGVYLSPSINTDKKAVEKGEPIKIYGQTVPDTDVKVHVNSDAEIVTKTNSLDTGDWSIIFDTNQVEEDLHTAKALFELQVGGNIIKSGFSRSISFYVGKEMPSESCPGADLNRDGRVNLTDFSILLYWWGTDNACADQDHDGTVNLVDFSIMMYHWTG